eukprot:scaffold7640_cov73-Skeletonema_dohrnii-CCMP3373.AAC.3
MEEPVHNAMNFFTRSLYHILKRRGRDDVGCWNWRVRRPGRGGPTPHTQSTVAIIRGRYGMRGSDVVVSSSMGQFIWGFGGQLIGSMGREVGVMILNDGGDYASSFSDFDFGPGAKAVAVAPAGRLHRISRGNHVRGRWGRPRLDKVSDQSIHNSLSQVNLVIVRSER